MKGVHFLSLDTTEDQRPRNWWARLRAHRAISYMPDSHAQTAAQTEHVVTGMQPFTKHNFRDSFHNVLSHTHTSTDPRTPR